MLHLHIGDRHLVLDTSEGAKRAWLTRKGGAAVKHEGKGRPQATAAPAPAQRKPAATGLSPEQRANLLQQLQGKSASPAAPKPQPASPKPQPAPAAQPARSISTFKPHPGQWPQGQPKPGPDQHDKPGYPSPYQGGQTPGTAPAGPVRNILRDMSKVYSGLEPHEYQTIARWMATQRVPMNAEVYRGVKNFGEIAAKLGANPVGSTFDLPSQQFFSTSGVRSVAQDFARSGGDGGVLTVHVPKGTPGIDVNKALGKDVDSAGERELLLGRGHKFKVTAYDPRARTMTVEIVGRMGDAALHLALDTTPGAKRAWITRKGGAAVKREGAGPRGPRTAKPETEGLTRGVTSPATPAPKPKRPGMPKSQTITLTPHKGGRLWTGRTDARATRLSKLEAGQLGEDIAIAYLKKHGLADARPLNMKKTNFAVDMVGDHEVYEVKTGQVSNSKDALQWRATIGKPGPTETALLASMGAEEKRAHNKRKEAAIIERKHAFVKEHSEKTGHATKGKTLTIILDPDKGLADVHIFDGFHKRIGYNSPAAKEGYVGTFRFHAGNPARREGRDLATVGRIPRGLRQSLGRMVLWVHP